MLIHRELEAGVAFVWHGGQDIEVYWSDAMAIRGPAIPVNGPDAAQPFETINVWSYESGWPRVSCREDFVEVCQMWLDENLGELGRYLEDSL